MNVSRLLKKSCLSAICCLVFLLSFHRTAAQLPDARYNRFQYHKYHWQVLRTQAFQVYFPQGYDSLASFASLQLPDIKAEVAAAMMRGLQEVPNIIIYPSMEQLYESNIGSNEDKAQTFPTINLKGSRIALAFSGSYAQFRSDLKAGWVRMVWAEAFKNDLEEQVTHKSGTLPEWYQEGCIYYFSEDWPLEKEEKLKHLLLDQRPENWEELLRLDGTLSGQAFCYFLSERYREDACKQIFFQMQNGKSLARALRLVTKHSLDVLGEQCFAFYRQRFPYPSDTPAVSDSLLENIRSKYPKEKVFRLLQSPDGESIASVTEKNNYRSVFIQQRRSGERIKLARYALPPWFALHEETRYPLLQWNDNHTLLVTLPVKGKIQVKKFTTAGKELDFRTLYGVDGVSELSVWDRNHWLLAAFRKGRGDIVVYDAARLNYTPLTDDAADNMELSLYSDGQNSRIAYRSGFPADSLWHPDSLAKPYGIYLKTIPSEFKMTADQKEVLLLPDSAYISGHQPVLLPTQRIRINNTQTGTLRSDTFSIVSGGIPIPGHSSTQSPWLSDYLRRKKTRDSLRAQEQRRKGEDVSFLAQVLNPANTAERTGIAKDSLRKVLAYAPQKVKPYILQLYSAYFSASVNNDYYINRYQPYQGYLGSFKFPEVGAMIQGGFSDLFENHHFNIGYRMPTGTEGSDFFSRYENTAGNTDWHVLFFRKVESLQPDPYRDWKDAQGRDYPQAAKVKTQYYELGFHRPLTYDVSLDFLTAARGDRTVFLATDKYSLGFEDLKQWWSISTLSFSINKLQPLEVPFMYRGWSVKWMTDGMLALEKPSMILYGTQLVGSYQQPLLRDIHFTVRARLGYSGGQSHILYNFGGTDNNIVPRVDSTVHFAQQAPYAFQTLVTPFRGYAQNSLYGSSYGLINLDVYVPLFRSLIPLKTGFSAINNLQLGVFSDLAQAVLPDEGLSGGGHGLVSWGLSARTLLAGYPIRFDLAWPGSFDDKPVWYLSLRL